MNILVRLALALAAAAPFLWAAQAPTPVLLPDVLTSIEAKPDAIVFEPNGAIVKFALTGTFDERLQNVGGPITARKHGAVEIDLVKYGDQSIVLTTINPATGAVTNKWYTKLEAAQLIRALFNDAWFRAMPPPLPTAPQATPRTATMTVQVAPTSRMEEIALDLQARRALRVVEPKP